MKYQLLFISFLTIVFFVGCNKDESNPVDGINNNSSVVTSISGKIENWNDGTDKVLKLSIFQNSNYISFGSSSIDANGNFNIQSLSPVPNDMLSVVSSILETGLSISNPSTMANTFKAKMKIYSGNSSTPYRETAKELNGNKTVGDFWIGYVYCDSDVNITGSYTYPAPYNEEYNYNLSFKKGWNKICFKVTESNASIKKFDVTNNEPEGGKYR